MDRSRYFDHAATTPVDPRVLQEMLPYFSEAAGNANSLHAPGREARSAVERARERVAALIGAEDPIQVFFTSGATEANNWAISMETGTVVASPFEHASVLEPVGDVGEILESVGLEIVPPRSPVGLACVMMANNELGTIWDPATAVQGRAERVHSDITQAVGKMPVSLEGIDFASLSSHKIYGPKGVGALYCRSFPQSAFMKGGGQEMGFRAGTLNVAGIVGLGAAAAIMTDEGPEERTRVAGLRAALLHELEGFPDYQVLGGPNTVPHIVSLSFFGVEGETVVIEADRAGFAISSRSACSSGSSTPSDALVALGLDEGWRRGTVRVGLGRSNREEDVVQLAQLLKRIVENLRRM